MNSVQSIAEVLRSEAAWMHSVGTRLESMANEIEGKGPEPPDPPPPPPRPPQHARGPLQSMIQAPTPPPLPIAPPLEFSGMEYIQAITSALRKYGPQTSRELADRFWACGLPRLDVAR